MLPSLDARIVLREEGIELTEDVITKKHLENMNKVLLATSWMVAYGYITEEFAAWYGANRYENGTFADRVSGVYGWVYWVVLFCNVLVPQIFWSKTARTSLPLMWVASILINVGMWSERFVIVVQSLHHDFLPSSWNIYRPTWVDWSLLLGSMGLFGTLFLLFLRFVPVVPVSEVKELRSEAERELGVGPADPAGA
jgi:molybdopterin-containing oxidoreductase family membrane subunit